MTFAGCNAVAIRPIIVTFALLLTIVVTTAKPAGDELSVKRIVSLEYPWFARLAGIQGNVELIATASHDGTVKSVRAISGPDPLVRAAKESLSKWLFAGCASNNDGCEVRVVFSFVLVGLCGVSEYCPTDFEADLPDRVRVKSKLAHAIVD
jgi:hypothetical protein